MGRNILIMTFCVTKWFQRKPHLKKKNIKDKKYYNVRISVFHFITVPVSSTQRVFKFSPRNQSAVKITTPHLYISQHVENGREKTTLFGYLATGTI